jgi:hypothetical protein
VDYFLQSDKIFQKPQLEKPTNLPRPNIPRLPKPGPKLAEIDFSVPIEIPLVNLKQKSKIQMKLKDIELEEFDLFYLPPMNSNSINKLCLTDF